ncbi:lysM domain receptor-like kinase 3 isoform X2 [Impatiens glandulifera]|uniref:lysM domain receptor-like kinase 3 isoform X2 n=1 Tax=Impatiens glandulifera TaxID=253017 RepID=UPI001FB0B7A1|nr:lysM domain receptor-like kinase 3 isoform X2 [Impatiens glandulifera]
MADTLLSILVVFLNLLQATSLLLLTTSSYQVSLGPNQTSYPLSCSNRTQTCSSLLYHQFNGLTQQQLSSYYSVDPSHIYRNDQQQQQQDWLVSVSCSCNEINGSLGTTVGFIYGTVYRVQPSDTFGDVSNKKYSGQALEVGGENTTFSPGNNVTVPLLCGCVDSSSQIIVVTYTAQPHDTLSDIARRFSARVDGILKLNKILNNSDFVDVGWVLFVPMEKNGISPPKSGGKSRKWERWSIVAGVLSTVTLVTLCALGAILVIRKRKTESIAKNHQLHSMQKHKLKTEGFVIETERPVTYEVEEIAEATKNFDESRRIGVGGYGTVYLGMIGQKEVAVKKMKSNLCKQFYAELKVLCKIHHINVVELLGYASGDEHLYLVYEYVQNGSLSDHLHHPLTKGFQALSWTARTQIAVDCAKGIEYIHDHTKARYVHRDIKTSNILLDQGLRAKVADFGLAKLVERRDDGDDDDDLIVTRLVGTPGYLPPESIKELQVTTKTDVFAFGVVLAELVTGSRALVRDTEEPEKLKSLITVVDKMFEDEDPLKALVAIIDENMQGNYPMENVFKMVEMARWCLSGEAVDRPDMRDVVVVLSQILTSSLEWEASLGSSSQLVIFNGNGR